MLVLEQNGSDIELLSRRYRKMIEFEMNLSSTNDVKDFVNTVSRYDFEVDLVSGRYIVDA